ncbi:MAG: hypothetical protein GYB31_08860 [Bacteroidetes bacterium]|nr:hypothetical protein [Bacteroidota bacterium]
MKQLIFILLPIFFASALQSQAPCPDFERLLREARQAVEEGSFEVAIYKYNAAKVCNPEAEADIDAEVLDVFNAINQLRLDAEKSRRSAERALKRERQAERRARQQAQRALSDELTFKAETVNDRTIAFRLAEYAYRIDPENPSARQQLIDCYYHDPLPWHYSLPESNGALEAVEWSNDGKWIATGSDDKFIRLYNSQNYALEAIYGPLNGEIESVDFTQNSAYVAASDEYGNLYIYELNAGQEVSWAQNLHPGIQATDFSFHPFKNELACSGSDGTVLIVSLEDASILDTLISQDAFVSSVEYSADGNDLMVANWNGNLSFYRTRDYELRYQHTGSGREKYSDAKYSPDQRMAALSTWNNEVIIYDLIDNEIYFTLGRHNASVFAVDFSFDGSKLVSTDMSGKVIVWDILTKSPLFELNGHLDIVFDACFSPDNNYLATVSRDGSALVWNLQSGISPFPLSSQRHTLEATAISDDEQYIATGSSEGKITVYDQENSRVYRELQSDESAITSLGFSPDGTKLVAGSRDGSASIWDLLSQKEIFQTENPGNPVVEAAFSPIGIYFGTSHQNGQVIIWDLIEGEEFELESGDSPVVDMDFSDINARFSVLTANQNGAVKLWDLSSLSPYFEYNLEGDSISCIRLSPNNRSIGIGTQNGVMHVLSVDQSTEDVVFQATQEGESIVDFDFSPDGSLVAMVDERGSISLFDWFNGEEFYNHFIEVPFTPLAVNFMQDQKVMISWNYMTPWILDYTQEHNVDFIALHAGHIQDVEILPETGRLITASRDHTIFVWDLETRSFINMMEGHAAGVNSIDYYDRERKLISGGEDGFIFIWDLETTTMISKWENPEKSISVVRMAPNEDKVFIAAVNAPVQVGDTYHGRIQDLANKDKVVLLEGHFDRILDAHFAPDKRSIATASLDQTARIWDIQTGKLQKLLPHDHFVLSLDYAPDGKRLVTACADRIARIWDVQSGEVLINLIGHENYVYSVQYSKDGSQIITSGGDGTAIIWDAETGELLYRLENTLPGPIKYVEFMPDGKSVFTASDTRAQTWLLDGARILAEAEANNYIDELRTQHLDTYNMKQYLEASGYSVEGLIKESKERKLLGVANYFKLLAKRAGRKQEADLLFQQAEALQEAYEKRSGN